MKKKILRFASDLSVLLCIVTAALWLRSFFISDMVTYAPNHSSYSVFSERGAVCWRWIGVGGLKPQWLFYSDHVVHGGYRSPPISRIRQWGFGIEKGLIWSPRKFPFLVLIVPDWAFMALFLGLPAVRQVKSRRLLAAAKNAAPTTAVNTPSEPQMV